MNKTIISIDVGFGNTKAVWTNPCITDSGTVDDVCFPSLAPLCHQPALERAGFGGLDRVVVDVDGKHYFVGKNPSLLDGLRMLDAGFVDRPEYRALIAGALHYYLKATANPSASIDVLVLGLPVSSFVSKRAALKAVGSRVHQVPVPASLRQRIGDDVLSMAAKKVVVVPQPLGALWLAAAEDHSVRMLGDDDVQLVIDPGFNTFDWFLARGLQPQLESSGSFPGGVSQIIREVAHAAGHALGTGDLNMLTTERALETGTLQHAGQRIDFTRFRPLAADSAQRVVDHFLLAFNFEAVGGTKIILAGGGAEHYVEALRKRLPGYDIRLPGESILANARGYWLIGREVLSMAQAA
jgi:plasmid segregation protein ParM